MPQTAKLDQMRCVPCEGGEPALSQKEIAEYASQVPEWKVTEGPRLVRTFKLRDFVHAMKFVNAMAEVAEEQGHHPDFFVHWNEVRVELWTHATGGLHANDFIVAARLDKVRV
jgi:4a-hydroxytetrahydrobiopterin dehydratase